MYLHQVVNVAAVATMDFVAVTARPLEPRSCPSVFVRCPSLDTPRAVKLRDDMDIVANRLLRAPPLYTRRTQLVALESKNYIAR